MPTIKLQRTNEFTNAATVTALRVFIPGTKSERRLWNWQKRGAILPACVWLAFLARAEKVSCNLIDNDVRQSGKRANLRDRHPIRSHVHNYYRARNWWRLILVRYPSHGGLPKVWTSALTLLYCCTRNRNPKPVQATQIRSTSSSKSSEM